MFKHDDIVALLQEASLPSEAELQGMLTKAKHLEGLSLQEVASLLAIEDASTWQKIFATAEFVKQEVYGRRVVLFAPLYLSNYCTNDCLYCGFRKSNTEIVRRVLSVEEVVKEAKILAEQGQKRLLLVTGENPNRSSLEYLIECVEEIYRHVDIRRINVNVAPMTVEEYQRLKACGIGTYQLFQETYHRPTYQALHLTGKKSDYDYRISAFDRAIQAGIDDVGLGVLFGLYDYKYELLALLSHSDYLDKTYGAGPHTISIPRLKPAKGVDFSSPYTVTDQQLMQIVALIRLAVPYTGIILSTREAQTLRQRLLHLGVSQVSAGSATTPGAYLDKEHSHDGEQFTLDDQRSLSEVVQGICQDGYIPSFCTACYRSQRTGTDFMKLAKTGDIKDICQVNALLTFKEYLADFGTKETVSTGEKTIKAELTAVQHQQLKTEVEQRFKRIDLGERDLYF